MKPLEASGDERRAARAKRAARNGHKGAIAWLTGLSGAGKSTIASALERELFHLGFHPYVLDGDQMRRGLCADLGFSQPDRTENVRRVAQVAGLMADAGLVVIAALISPYRDDRLIARELASQAGDFIEVFVDAPLEVCEERDPKGLYARARRGAISDFTGVSAPYEIPLKPEITVRTNHQTVSESVAAIVQFILPRLRVQ